MGMPNRKIYLTDQERARLAELATSQGASPSAALRLELEEYGERPAVVPADVSSFTFRCPDEVWEAAAERAERERTTVTAVVSRLLAS